MNASGKIFLKKPREYAIIGAVEVDEDILFRQISLKSDVSKVEMLTCRNIH